jgi:type III restriction enzyme
MELKAYQQKTLTRLRDYLHALRGTLASREQARALNIPYEWDVDAWRQVSQVHYQPRKNGMGEAVPTVCFKVPTGGGKTLLAAKAIDAICNLYRGANTGLVLWIVPTTQIYRQTLAALRDKAHPYRISLDQTSGDRTLIVEKDTRFSPADMRESLVVLLLMLPSANRQNKETLRLFKDSGGFNRFFPPEDHWAEHGALLQQIPNLDSYATAGGMFGAVVKTSLGNTLRRLNPLIVLDEGHKAYSQTAQATLLSFNPSFILELSATPPKGSNLLVEISGQDVHREGMIKLPLHLHTQASADWRDTLRASHLYRAELERTAQQYEAETGVYIRPICLIQVERTGEKQRGKGYTHAEDARAFLIRECGILPDEVAVKSSERDEIERIDLLDRDCQIRYIITRQALQEGWDCPFAYILTVLTNPEGKIGITQLVGRVLRQPYARKTGRAALDESYVYCHRAKAGNLLGEIRAELQSEGLGDLAGQIVTARSPAATVALVDVPVRQQLRQRIGKVYLPCFVLPDGQGGFREIEYEIDILSHINWSQVRLDHFATLSPNPTSAGNTHTVIGLDETLTALQATEAAPTRIDPVFMTRQLLDIVPNPWVAYDYVQEVLQRLRANSWGDEQIGCDLGFVIGELKKIIIDERRRLAKEVFLDLVKRNELRFYLIAGSPDTLLPDRMCIPHEGVRINQDSCNGREKDIALYLDQQYWVLTWYRSAVPGGYRIQGWQEQRVYSDFVVLGHDVPDGLNLPKLSTVYVLETKGIHLKNNDDTTYKQELFKLCYEQSQPRPWDDITQSFSDHRLQFQALFENEWRNVINAMFSA